MSHCVVLLVEDHADSRALYAYDLRRSGFRVHEAGTASQAIQSASRSVPDVVVADLLLPDLDGVQLCRTLRHSATTKDVPIIAVTANSDAEIARAAQAAGCASVLLKPCLPADVRAEIQRVLADARRARRRSSAALDRAHVLTRKSAVLKLKADRLNTRVNDEAILSRVRAEFYEMPGLRLSVDQAARLFGVDRATAERLLEQLVTEQFLRATPSGMYLRVA